MASKWSLSQRLGFWALFAISIVSCSRPAQDAQSGGSQQGSVLATVKQTGHLKAGYIKYPPFVIQDPQSGKLSGYFVDLITVDRNGAIKDKPEILRAYLAQHQHSFAFQTHFLSPVWRADT